MIRYNTRISLPSILVLQTNPKTKTKQKIVWRLKKPPSEFGCHGNTLINTFCVNIDLRSEYFVNDAECYWTQSRNQRDRLTTRGARWPSQRGRSCGCSPCLRIHSGLSDWLRLMAEEENERKVYRFSLLVRVDVSLYSRFTPKSDQFRISPAASPEIHHTVWRTWLFIAYWDERWLYHHFSPPHLYISL